MLVPASISFAQTAAKPAAAKPAGAARTIEITANDTMKYNVSSIAAKPGEQVRVKLTSSGTMPKIAMAHNFILLKKTADVAAFANAAINARATDFIPPAMKDQVLASTGLAGNGESVEVTFKAPTAPGQYPFLCTFPGHFAVGMKGVLVVK
jgi:azurin